jgi:nitrogenase molybdenum-iron protein alpha/beta subunit
MRANVNLSRKATTEVPVDAKIRKRPVKRISERIIQEAAAGETKLKASQTHNKANLLLYVQEIRT